MTAPVHPIPAHAPRPDASAAPSPPRAAEAHHPIVALTQHELRALDFIRETIAATGTAPTLEEIAAGLGLRSRSNAHRIVESLERAGLLVKTPARLRGLALADGPRLFTVPTVALRAELARRAVEPAPGSFKAAIASALAVIEDDRTIFFDCHTIDGNPASLTSDEALIVAEYDAAIEALKSVMAA